MYDASQKLSEHFTLKEFLVGLNYGYPVRADIVEHIVMLCFFGLEPVRKKYGPVTITSGWRTDEHNTRVGGSPTSQHITGRACDFIVKSVPSAIIYPELHTWWPGQLFYYAIAGHIHIGLPQLGLFPTHNILNK